MQTKQIQQCLKQAICSDSKWIVIHSSLVHLDIEEHALLSFKWEFLKAIRLLIAEGYHFAFPAFTFSFTKTGIFHNKLPSEVGVLADWVNNLLGSIRTKHPIYSHVLIGDDVEAALECSTETCFGEGSIYEYFEKLNATIMMLGCDNNIHICLYVIKIYQLKTILLSAYQVYGKRKKLSLHLFQKVNCKASHFTTLLINAI